MIIKNDWPRAMFAEIESDAVRYVDIAKELSPNLTSNGFESGQRLAQYRADMTDDDSVAQFVRAAWWLSGVPKRQTVNRRASSYTWKHIAERYHERFLKERGKNGNWYISNGMFLAACIVMGVKVEPIRNSPNAFVNLSDRALEYS